METWLLAFKEFIFFLFCLTNKDAIWGTTVQTITTRKKNIQNLLMSVTSKNLETSRTKNPDSSGLCVSNIQSAALKWSDLRYKWQPDMQRDRIRNRRNFSAERCTAIIYIILSFLVSHHIVHRPNDRTAHHVSSNKWGYSSCLVFCFFDIFYSFL